MYEAYDQVENMPWTGVYTCAFYWFVNPSKMNLRFSRKEMWLFNFCPKITLSVSSFI